LYVSEISPNGGFFKLLAQECARMAWTLPQHQHLHGNNVEFIRNLFGEWIPRYLFSLEKKHYIDQFTVGYHVEAMKIRDINTVQKLIENDLQNVNLYIEAARSLLNQGKFSPARRYVEDALELNPNNSTLTEMYQQLLNKP
jgi:tetratricopeptide (TPR) repeat protein